MLPSAVLISHPRSVFREVHDSISLSTHTHSPTHPLTHSLTSAPLAKDADVPQGGWIRGSSIEYDEWAAAAGDSRWSYEGVLPWLKKAESWYESHPEQHGHDGPIAVASCRSTGREFPLTEPLASAWDELGVPVLPGLDQNSGVNLGRAQLCEARRDGLRQHAAINYKLDGVDILTHTLVAKVVLEKGDGSKPPKAVGVELADGKVINGAEVIVSAGTFKSPQLLMLSGVGPATQLEQHGIAPLVDLPAVGQNVHDHASFYQFWKLKDPERGLTLGSPNPIFQKPEFTKGVPTDWLVCTDVPHDGLAAAIEKDEGKAPSATEHPLLKQARSHNENLLLYVKLPVPGVPPDYAHLTSLSVSFLPTSRGTIELASGDASAAPKISMNYLATETDKFVFRENLRQLTRLMLGTKFGKEYIEGESVPPVPGMEALQLDDGDDKLDTRLKLAATTTWHAGGSCSMGSVVDAEFRVKGVEGLRVIDASVLPVPLSSHIQAAVYALSEQGAAMLAGKA